jgi:hypothetical protein
VGEKRKCVENVAAVDEGCPVKCGHPGCIVVLLNSLLLLLLLLLLLQVARGCRRWTQKSLVAQWVVRDKINTTKLSQC